VLDAGVLVRCAAVEMTHIELAGKNRLPAASARSAAGGDLLGEDLAQPWVTPAVPRVVFGAQATRSCKEFEKSRAGAPLSRLNLLPDG
jgi:hypothetical protein